MPSSIEEFDSLSSEDRLGPPKYDMIGVLMVFLSMLIIGVMVGIGILLLIYLVLGEFTIESGASPVLLAFVTFMVLTFGNMLYVFILGKIFPHAYSRSRTSLSQTMLASIVLYIVFIPVYLLLSTAQPTGSSYIL
jgi:magnesium-transporting ATPase (P-type)